MTDGTEGIEEAAEMAAQTAALIPALLQSNAVAGRNRNLAKLYGMQYGRRGPAPKRPKRRKWGN